MTKDTSVGIEYKGEIYGRIWEAITWDKEEREYQHLANALFMAAKEDIIAEKSKLGKYTRKTKEVYGILAITVQEVDDTDIFFTENLYKVIEAFCKNEPDKDKRELAESELKKKLLPSYKTLKDRLNDVRVRGVENSALEAVGKACKISLKTMVVIVGAVAAALNIAAMFTPAMPAAVMTGVTGAEIVSGVVMPFTTKASKDLMNIRQHMKEVLKETKGPPESKGNNFMQKVRQWIH